MLPTTCDATPAPSTTTCSLLSPALQRYISDCVLARLGLGGPGAPSFRFQLYPVLGDAASAAALCRDLAVPDASRPPGLIALFGQVNEGLEVELAMARHLRLMQAHNKQLHLLSSGLDGAGDKLQLYLGDGRYEVLVLHEHARRLSCVMPCPMLVFSPLPG